MTITKSITRPITRSITSLIDGAGDIARYFIDLDSSLDSHYAYDSVLMFGTGDTFEFEFLAPTSTTPGFEYLTDGDDGVNRGRLILSDGGSWNFDALMTVEVDGLSITDSDNYPIDGKLHTVKITFVSAGKIKYLGSNSNPGSFYDGILVNPVSTISGVTETYTLGNSTGDVESPTEEAFGSELWDDTPEIGSDWTDEGGGVYSYIGTDTSNTLSENTIFDLTKSYQVTFDVVGITGEMKVFRTPDVMKFDVDGSYIFTFPPTEFTGLHFTRNKGFVNCTISNVSVREIITNSIDYVNIPDSNRELYQLDKTLGQWDNISETQVLQPVIDIFKPERYFSLLDATLSSHFLVSTALVFNTADELEFNFTAPTSILSPREHLFDSDANVAGRARMVMDVDGTWDTGGSFDWFVDGVATTEIDPYPIDGKEHHIRCVFTDTAQKVVTFGSRFNINEGYDGILSNIKATISAVETNFIVDLSTGTAEASLEASNTLNYVNIPDTNRELFELAISGTDWYNLTPSPVLQTLIKIYPFSS